MSLHTASVDILTAKDDPKLRYTPNGILSQDLNYLLDEIITCDNTYCYDLREMIFESIQLTLAFYDPASYTAIQQCSGEPERIDECSDLYSDAFAEFSPVVFQLIEEKRQESSPDPLVDYDGTLYESPFWFEHSGNVWRRITHQSRLVKPERECRQLTKLADQCLEDDSISHKQCLDLYANSLACLPGSYCPYLRSNLMTCMHGLEIFEYEAMRNCISAIPNYLPCQTGYVKPQKTNGEDGVKLSSSSSASIGGGSSSSSSSSSGANSIKEQQQFGI